MTTHSTTSAPLPVGNLKLEFFLNWVLLQPRLLGALPQVPHLLGALPLVPPRGSPPPSDPPRDHPPLRVPPWGLPLGLPPRRGFLGVIPI